MVDVLIFSKDRAAQLDALLQSMERYFPYASSIVALVAWSDVQHNYAYQECGRRFSGRTPAITLIPQAGFERNLWWWLNRCERPIMFLVDDDLFYRPAPPRTGLPFSYALGNNLTYSETQGVEQIPPGELAFDWAPGGDPRAGDFGYPLTVDATVYDKSTILPLLGFHFDNPTQLEAGLANQWRTFHETTPIMHMAEESSVVSIPHNRVTTGSMNPISGLACFSVERLRDDYLAGKRIRLEEMDFSNIHDRHTAVPYVIR